MPAPTNTCFAQVNANFNEQAHKSLVRHAISGWPRRDCRLLEFGCGSGEWLEHFGNYGFDVTGQESNLTLAEAAKNCLGHRAEIVVNNPELMPFDDKSFDYAVWHIDNITNLDIRAVVSEVLRMAAVSALFTFANTASLHAIGNLLASCFNKQASSAIHFYNPLKIWSICAQKAPKGSSFFWYSNLLAPAWSWKPNRLATYLNNVICPFPLGALAVLRVDFSPPFATNNLLLQHSSKETVRAAALNGMGNTGNMSAQKDK